jgi:hypothetical protein
VANCGGDGSGSARRIIASAALSITTSPEPLLDFGRYNMPRPVEQNLMTTTSPPAIRAAVRIALVFIQVDDQLLKAKCAIEIRPPRGLNRALRPEKIFSSPRDCRGLPSFCIQ